MMGLYEHPTNKNNRPTSITGSMIKTPLTNVDATSSIVLTFSKTLQAQAILNCSASVAMTNPGVTIRYTHGNILVDSPIYRPMSFTVQYFDSPKSGKVIKEEKKTFDIVGGGWHYEADEVARCVRDGKLESELWGHEKSLVVMDIFDEVRRQGDYVFPPGVEYVV